MRVCVVGGGIAGLSAAHLLSAHPEAEVTCYEQAARLGGRADVEDGREHCPRVFLEDYVHLFRMMREIPAPDGGSVRDSLRRLHRFARTGDGAWVEISHLYRVMAKELSSADRLRFTWNWRPSPLLGEHRPRERGANRYGSVFNYSLSSVLRMAGNLFRSKIGYALPGPTDSCLIDPWAAFLRQRGVRFETGCRVTRLKPCADHVRVHTCEAVADFDAVVVTAFVPDLIALLNASRLDHGIREVDHMHCVAHTIALDPREPVLARTPDPAVYQCQGISVLVQPEAARCVALCIRNKRTDPEYVLDIVRATLPLDFPVQGILSRPNQRPGEAILSGDYTRVDRILRVPASRVHFAGSHVSNAYPMDSAEGAARTALAAVRSLLRAHAQEADLGDRAAGHA
ncbi:FAD-dependent oxidoreductase [Actinomadura scrupuli]|uniref:FAD-dependent oxidoreductase n=1 Tax=Actinomadura scrupuli TaxID=559629 RepID=UPI003D98AC40